MVTADEKLGLSYTNENWLDKGTAEHPQAKPELHEKKFMVCVLWGSEWHDSLRNA